MALKQTISRALLDISPKHWLDLSIARRNKNFGPEFWLLPSLCRGEVALDVGGNQGWFAYFLSRCSQTVHVFEPNPICLAQIRRVQTKNMTIHEVALSDRSGEATMRFDPGNTGVGTIEGANQLDNNPGIRDIQELVVPIRTLDSFGIANVGFIKIDVEGHEPAVLRGARNLLKRARPVLMLELEFRHNPAAFDEVWKVLDPLGYRMLGCSAAGLVEVNRNQIHDLQRGRPETNPDYLNNFVFAPPERTDL